MRRPTLLCIVPLAIDLPAVAVLSSRYLAPLLLIEPTTITHAVVVYPLIKIALSPVGTRRLPGSLLTIAQAVGDALLLIGLAIINTVWRDM